MFSIYFLLNDVYINREKLAYNNFCDIFFLVYIVAVLISNFQLPFSACRVACSFGNSIAFTIDNGANPYYFATEIEYENGGSDLVAIELKQANSDTWLPMQRSWGARWALNLGLQLQAPLSIKLTEQGKGYYKTIVADSVIPHGWQPGQVYRSVVNF